MKKNLSLAFFFATLFFAFAVSAQASAGLATVETPWAWYISRSSALLGFVLLYISIFLGLTIRIPFLSKIFSPLYSVDMHCWISLQAWLLALVHGVALLFDKFLNFGFGDVFIPFSSSYEKNFVALGVIGFYLMLLLIATSYGRKFISQKFWRATHFLNVGLYVVIIVHALYLGTDLKEGLLRGIFIWANAFLVFVMLWNIETRIWNAMKKIIKIG